MESPQALFAVENLFELSSRGVIVLLGQIKSGSVRAGMRTKVSIDGQLHMVATIKSVEFADGPGRASAVGLLLHTPEPDVRAMWQALCRAGDVLPVTDGAAS
jgi:hypothetical protein